MINGIRIRPSDRIALVCLMVLLSPVVNGCTPGDTDTPSIADLPTFRIEQDLRIDGDKVNLVPIGWMGVARNGTIAVLQRQIRGVRFFDPSGNDLGLLGRQGEGPGEFQRPVRAGWIGDTLWVSDTQLGRVTLISTAPEFVRTLPPLMGARPAPGNEARFPVFARAFPYAIYSDGSILIAALGPTGEVESQAYEGSPLFRASGDGLIERVVLEIPLDTAGGFSVTFEGGSAFGYVPFFPSPSWALAPDGSRIGTLTTDISGPEVGTFRVSVSDALGGQIFSRAYPYTGIPVPEHVVDSVLEDRANRASHPGISRAYRTEIKSRVPPIYPPVEKIVLGFDGRTWIGLYGGDESEPWLILDPEGNPLGRVVLPARTTLHVADANHVWALERDELDIESIVRYRLRERD